MENDDNNLGKRRLLFYSVLASLITILFMWINYEISKSEVNERITLLEQKVGLDPSPAVKALEENKVLQKQVESLISENNELRGQTANLSESLADLLNLTFEHIDNHQITNQTTLFYDVKGYNLIGTKFGTFAASLLETKPSRNGVEITLALVNPSLYYFTDAKVTVTANGQYGEAVLTLIPRLNVVSVLLSPIKSEDITSLDVKLELNRINFN